MHRSPLDAARVALAAAAIATGLAGCGSGSSSDGGVTTATTETIPQLGKATPASLGTGACAALATFAFAGTSITSTATVAAGGLVTTGSTTTSPEHCLVVGKMNERTSAVDGLVYAIGFQMRLPKDWNGRFFYQANGGIDGSVSTAVGGILGGAPTTTGLDLGFAVISSDAGHPGSYGPFFGLDPQARLDYGYNAVAQLTPMAKAVINAAYGKVPDRSYFAGCSNGGRHALVAAARFADHYDGILAGNPGFNLPKAAVAQLYGVQQYARVATALLASGDPDISTAFTAAELSLVASRITAKCDSLDGANDGIVGDTKGCQAAFNLALDVPTCAGPRDGTCLSADQKSVMGNIFGGAKTTTGTALYSSFPFDPGIGAANFRVWEFTNSINLDPGATAFIFTTAPADRAAFIAIPGVRYARNFNMDTDAPKIFATDATYTVAPMTFMTPPDPTNLSKLKLRGAKLMVFHGIADGVFSPDDTARWYEGLNTANSGNAAVFARYYPVPGMNHCSGGPATDQFNMVASLIDWVENGVAPDRVIAKVRGAGANVVNAELPASWTAARTRPLCPYPKIAKFNASGSIEDAASFTCQ